MRTVVALHGGVNEWPSCDVKDVDLIGIPVVHLIEGEGLGGLAIACGQEAFIDWLQIRISTPDERSMPQEPHAPLGL